MLVLAALLLALLPAIAIAYPLLTRKTYREFLDDEGSPQEELARRWDAAVHGLKSAELESAIGNLSDEDYGWLRRQYMTEAAQILKAMQLDYDEEEKLLADAAREVDEVRARVQGPQEPDIVTEDAAQSSGTFREVVSE